MVLSSLLFGLCLSDDWDKLASALTKELGGNFSHKGFTLKELLLGSFYYLIQPELLYFKNVHMLWTCQWKLKKWRLRIICNHIDLDASNFQAEIAVKGIDKLQSLLFVCDPFLWMSEKFSSNLIITDRDFLPDLRSISPAKQMNRLLILGARQWWLELISKRSDPLNYSSH